MSLLVLCLGVAEEGDAPSASPHSGAAVIYKNPRPYDGIQLVGVAAGFIRKSGYRFISQKQPDDLEIVVAQVAVSHRSSIQERRRLFQQVCWEGCIVKAKGVFSPQSALSLSMVGMLLDPEKENTGNEAETFFECTDFYC